MGRKVICCQVFVVFKMRSAWHSQFRGSEIQLRFAQCKRAEELNAVLGQYAVRIFNRSIEHLPAVTSQVSRQCLWEFDLRALQVRILAPEFPAEEVQGHGCASAQQKSLGQDMHIAIYAPGLFSKLGFSLEQASEKV